MVGQIPIHCIVVLPEQVVYVLSGWQICVVIQVNFLLGIQFTVSNVGYMEERNNCSFNGVELSIMELKNLFESVV